MSDNNMVLWESVQKTQPHNVKNVSIGQRKFKTICPQSQRMEATRCFGPFGMGWGVTGEEYQIVKLDGQQPLLVYMADLWYIIDKKRCSFPIVASISMTMFRTTKNNYVLDDDCYKKVATDALTKGLSFLGFNADVFLGLYDDNKYVEGIVRENQEKAKAELANIIATPEEMKSFSEKINEYKNLCKDKGVEVFEVDPEVLSSLDENKPIGIMMLKEEGRKIQKYMKEMGAL